MSKEWLSMMFGCMVGALFSSGLWLFMPKSETATLYYHQVGIYSQGENALNMKAQVEGQGLEAYVLNKNDQAVVVCGFVFSKEESSAIEQTLQGAGMSFIAKEVSIDGQMKDEFENGVVDGLITELESR